MKRKKFEHKCFLLWTLCPRLAGQALYLPRLGMAFVPLCLCFILSNAGVCFADNDTMPIDDLRVPLEYYEDGKIKSQLFSDSAKIATDGDIAALNPSVKFYDEEGKIITAIKAEECRYDRDDRTATSESKVSFEKEGIVISGTGFEWNANEQFVKIHDNVKVVLTRGRFKRFKVQGSPPGGSAEAERLGKPAGPSTSLDEILPIRNATHSVATENPEPGTLNQSVTNNTVITSKYLRFDYNRSIAVFEEDVVVIDPQIRIESDRLNVLFDRNNNVKSVTALGNVHLWHGDKTATCRKAVYLVGQGEVILMGKAVVREPKGLAEGDKIKYLIDEGKVSCEPGRMVIFPQEKNN